MNLLLDTHTFIWFIEGDKNLSKRAKEKILDPSNIKFVSIASIWEIAVKISLGKLKINRPFEAILTQIEDSGFEILPIAFEHTLVVSRLDFFHRDPFDRIIIAQALAENMTIISRDKNFENYGVNILW